MTAGCGGQVLDAINRYCGKMKKETLPVSVVVVGHNYASFLRDCLESIEQQNPGPAEVIYVDNASTDGSVQVARDAGVRVAVVGPQERNICACRNRGALMTRQPFLLFLDADDLLRPGYVKQLHDVIKGDWRIGITFPDVNLFGLERHAKAGVKRDVSRSQLSRLNFIPCPSLVRRTAFEQSGRWDGLPCFQDWDLWLRVVNRGWLYKYVPEAVLDVRSHADSLTASYRHRTPVYQEVLRRQPMTVFTPFGPGGSVLGERYFTMIEQLGLNWDRTTLLFYDNTLNTSWHDRLRGYLRDSPARNTGYIRDDTLVTFYDAASRAAIVPERMAEIWMRASKMFDGEFVLSIEHDMEPEAPGAARRLYEGIGPDIAAVSATYRSRPANQVGRLLDFDWTSRSGHLVLRPMVERPGNLPNPPTEGCTDTGATGIGFVLMRRDILDGFTYPVGQADTWWGQDFGIWRHVAELGQRLLIHWGVSVRHYSTPTEWV